MSTLVTLRPNGATGYGASVVNTGGAASMQAALADNLDTTYVTVREGGVVVDFDTTSIPAGAQIRSVAARVKFSGIPFSASYVRVGWGPGTKRFGPYQSVINPPAGEYAFPAQSRNPDGNAWTQADIDALQIDAYGWSTWIGDDAFFYAMYIDVIYNEAPTATGTLPNGNTPTSRPTFAGTYADPDSDVMERCRFKVVDVNKITGSFDPNTFTNWDADSGELFTPYLSWQCNVDLKDGVTYRAYIWVADKDSNGRYNTVTITAPYAYCTIAQEPPAVPTVLMLEDSSLSDFTTAVLLTVTDRQSILPNIDDGSFEGSIGSWTADSGCTLSRSSTNAEFGTFKMVVTPTTNGVDCKAKTGATTGVVPGQVYSARAAFRGTVNQRQCQPQIWWYTAADAFISATSGVARTAGNGSYSESFVRGVAPPTAHHARLAVVVSSPSVGDLHYVDGCTLVPFEINIFFNPEFAFDVNNDGVADYWNKVDNGTLPATYSLDFVNVGFGVNSQKVQWSGNTGHGNVGIMQSNYLVSGGDYNGDVYLYSESGCTFYVSVQGGTTYGPFTAAPGAWTQYHWIQSPFAGSTGPKQISVYATDTAGDFSINYMSCYLGSAAFNTFTGNRFTYVRPGLLSSARTQIQRSDDDGQTWADIERPILYVSGVPQFFDIANYDSDSVSQLFSFYDFEAPRGKWVTYRVRAVANSDVGFIASAWSKWERIFLPILDNWVLQTLDAQVICPLRIEWETFEEDEPIDTAEFDPIDSDETIVLHGRIRGNRMSGRAMFFDDETFQLYNGVRRRRATLLLQDSNGRSWYVRFVGNRKAPERRWNGEIERRVDVDLVEVRP